MSEKNSPDAIVIRGARQNNLRNLTLSIPTNNGTDVVRTPPRAAARRPDSVTLARLPILVARVFATSSAAFPGRFTYCRGPTSFWYRSGVMR